MRVLVACEFSGVVRRAFESRGHLAYSCDFLPAEDGGRHIQGDVLKVLRYGWDLMVAHPPCQNLAASGARYLAKKRKSGAVRRSADFFMALVNAPIPRIAIENPVGVMSTLYRKPDQIIQPYWFGHPESKKTCLWLKNLPLLQPTRILPLPKSGHWANQTPSGQNRLPPSPDRWKLRAKTYEGIAAAFADQWGRLPVED